MASSFPDLNWAKQSILEDGRAEVLDCDNQVHKFKTIIESNNWLLEDEYESYENLDSDDEFQYEIKLSNIEPPKDGKMYVKNT